MFSKVLFKEFNPFLFNMYKQSPKQPINIKLKKCNINKKILPGTNKVIKIEPDPSMLNTELNGGEKSDTNVHVTYHVIAETYQCNDLGKKSIFLTIIWLSICSSVLF